MRRWSTPWYALCLLAGASLAVVAGALHPALRGDGAAQLAAIAACRAWRAIHWAFLFGGPLALAGLAGLAAAHAGTPGAAAARAGALVAVLAYAGWMVIVAFMAGAGWALAQRYAAAEAGMTATRAVFVYDTLHPFALAAQRAGAMALGVATFLLGCAVRRGGVLPRWLGTGGAAAGVVAMGLALAFAEDTRADQAAFVLPVLWQVAVGALLVRRAPAAQGG
jgi:hypothetical protein